MENSQVLGLDPSLTMLTLHRHPSGVATGICCVVLNSFMYLLRPITMT
jgi:hypothetical protein